MDFAAMQFWFNMVVAIVNATLWLFVWNSNRNRVTREKMEEMEETFSQKVEMLVVEVSRMDERLKKSIGHPELEPLHKRLNNIDKQLSEMTGEFKGQKHLLDLIHQSTLDKGNKR